MPFNDYLLFLLEVNYLYQKFVLSE